MLSEKKLEYDVVKAKCSGRERILGSRLIYLIRNVDQGRL